MPADVADGLVLDVPQEVVDIFRQHAQKPTVRQLERAFGRGERGEPRKHVSARLMRSLGTGVNPTDFPPGDGAHRAAEKPFLQRTRFCNCGGGGARGGDERRGAYYRNA